MSLSSFQVSFLLAGELQRIGMGPSTCSLGTCSVLVLGLDARRVLSEHQGMPEWYKTGEKPTLNAEKIGSSNFKVDIKFTKKFQERK